MEHLDWTQDLMEDDNGKNNCIHTRTETEYDVENQRQILQAVDTIKNELNFSFQRDLKEEQDTYNYFLS
jgi:hypothetical protein